MPTDAIEVARALLPYRSERECVLIRGAVASLGIGSSCVVFAELSDAESASPSQVADALDLANAYWTAASEWDRRLFREVAHLTVRARSCSSRELEDETPYIASLYEHVELFRAMLQSRVANLAPDEARLWDGLVVEWRLEEVLKAVQERLSTLQQMHVRILDIAAGAHRRRLDTAVLVFTFLSAVATTTQILDFTQRISNRSVDVRSLIATMVTAVAFAALVALLLARRLGFAWRKGYATATDFRPPMSSSRE